MRAVWGKIIYEVNMEFVKRGGLSRENRAKSLKFFILEGKGKNDFY
jgi:hypothetical protein